MSIKSKQVNFSVNGKKILEDISISLNSGEILSLVGPNGSGKSTFLKILSGDLKPTAGDIFYNDIEINNISILNRAKMRSVMTQSPQIVYDFTAREIIEMGWISKGDSHKSNLFDGALNKIIKICDLREFIDRKFNFLSGGEKRRVHFARTLIQVWNDNLQNDPSFMFLDEPTSNLDLYHELKLLKILKNKSKKGKGILLIIHNLNLAFKFSDKIGIFKNGKLLSFGEPREVFTNEILFDVFKIPIKVNSKNSTLNIY